MKHTTIAILFFAILSLSLHGMEPEQPAAPRQELPLQITLVSNVTGDTGTVTLMAELLPAPFAGIAFKQMKERRNAKLDVNYPSYFFPLFRRLLYLAKTFENLPADSPLWKASTSALLQGPEFDRVRGADLTTTIERLDHLRAMLDYYQLPKGIENAATGKIEQLIKEHYLATGQEIELPGINWGFSVAELVQLDKLRPNVIVARPENLTQNQPAQLITLNLDNYRLNSLEGASRLLESRGLHPQKNKVVAINLSNNNFASLDNSTMRFFAGCTSLEILRLDHNMLTRLPGQFLLQCIQLQRIYLNYNQLSELSPQFLINCSQLGVLTLANNQLQNLPNDFLARCPQLIELSIANNRLSQLPNQFLANCHELNGLTLDDNQLTQLPNQFLSNCTKLKRLVLSRNQLTQLPDNFLANCLKLEDLFLHINKLTALPTHFLLNNKQLRIVTLESNSFDIKEILSNAPEHIQKAIETARKWHQDEQAKKQKEKQQGPPKKAKTK